MGSSRDRLVVNLLLAVLVIVGVSASVSDTLDALYSVIAFWAFLIGGVFAAIKILIWWLDFDPVLGREARKSWSRNGETVRLLNSGQPEAARELARRLAETEKIQEQVRLGVVPPSKGS